MEEQRGEFMRDEGSLGQPVFVLFCCLKAIAEHARTFHHAITTHARRKNAALPMR